MAALSHLTSASHPSHTDLGFYPHKKVEISLLAYSPQPGTSTSDVVPIKDSLCNVTKVTLDFLFESIIHYEICILGYFLEISMSSSPHILK